MQGASTSIKHACHSSLSLSKSHEPCPCSKEKQGSLSAQRRTQLDSASPVHGAECASTRRASSTQQRASKSRQARSTATLQPTTQFRPLKIVLGKRNGTKHVCTQEPRHRLIVQPGGALHEVCSKNTPFLGPMAGQKPSAQTCPQRVQGVIMHETETLHRNLGTVTGAFIGRRSRHFWHFSCALEGAASSAEKRDEGWSCARAALQRVCVCVCVRACVCVCINLRVRVARCHIYVTPRLPSPSLSVS